MNFDLGFKVPSADVATVEKFFADHQAFMKSTHAGPDEPKALAYMVTKTPEPADPNDPSKGVTDFTIYAMSETYSGMEACGKHMEVAKATSDILPRFMDTVTKYATGTSLMSPVINKMTAKTTPLTTVKPGCRAMNFIYKVPDAEAAAVDAFFVEHQAFMDETHKTTGNTEPVILYYTATKAAELKDSDDPSKGTTGFQMYALSEIYKGMPGCEAHIAAGQAKPVFFAKFQEIVGKYAISSSMMGEVICSM